MLPGDGEPASAYSASARSFSTRLNLRAIASGHKGSAAELYVGMRSFAVDDCHEDSFLARTASFHLFPRFLATARLPRLPLLPAFSSAPAGAAPVLDNMIEVAMRGGRRV